MLVLSRKEGEVITIGGGISIQVLAIQGAKVRLGITAPEGTAIHRQEVQQLIDKKLAEANRAQQGVVAG